MAQMSESTLLASVNQAKDDAVRNQGEFIKKSEDFMRRYLGDKYGNEIAGQSQVISTDVADTVESDMPALAEVFLSDNEIMSFQPKVFGERASRESKQKNVYINRLIRDQEDSFAVLHGWLKDTLIQKLGVVKYEYVEEEISEEIEYDGLDDEELAMILADVKQENIIGQDSDEDGHYVKFKDERVKKDIVIRGIPTEDFIISRNAISKDQAEIVGDVTLLTKGELIALDYDEDLVRSLPIENNDNDDQSNSNLKAIRFEDEGGLNDTNEVLDWTSQKVKVYDLYMLIDFDGDGIVERRRIIWAGNKILDNDQFNHVPYAINSAILMPHKVIGRSRAEVTMQTQLIKTTLYRQVLNNIYRVNNPRSVINPQNTNQDDVMTQRLSGLVRTKGDPQTAVGQLVTPYIGDQALTVIQYVDSVAARNTGAQMANQGLDSDNLYKETATRFEGVEEAAEAKIKLVARVISETGMRQLYQGLVWLTSRYHNDTREILLSGQAFKIMPKMWRHEDRLVSNVGLAAGDNDQVLANMGALLTIMNQMQQTGSILVDQKKVYNVLNKTVQAMGLHRIEDYFNDPEIPAQQLIAQNEQLMNMVEQLQANQQNPFTEAELIKAQATLTKAQGDNQVKLLEATAKRDLELDKLAQQMQQFIVQKEFDYTKLEQEQDTDIPGKGVNG